MAHRQTFKLGLDGVDAFGIIYFGQYCHWFQHALEGLFSQAGHELRSIIGDGLGFPLARLEMDFYKPVRLSDVVEAECTIVATGKRSIRVRVRFTDAAGDLAAEMYTTQVTTRTDFSAEPVPRWIEDLVESGSPAAI